MKTEAEVRQYMQDLLTCADRPCDCRGTRHEAQCAIGEKLMRTVAASLSWVLGEDEDMQGVVDQIRRGARDHPRRISPR